MHSRRKRIPSLLVIIFMLLISAQNKHFTVCQALEAKWTPNDKDGSGGPLPQSQNQRQRLLDLEQAIKSAPDPEKTLREVAKNNNMSPEDLVQMLQQNRQDLQRASHMQSATNTPPRQLLQLLGSICVMVGRYASHHPRSFGVTVATLLLLLYALYMGPRTGVVLSTKKGLLLSNGHTTMWEPPTAYIHNYMNTHYHHSSSRRKGMTPSIPLDRIGLSSQRKGILLQLDDGDSSDSIPLPIDTLTVDPVGRKAKHPLNKKLSLVVTARKSIPYVTNEDDADIAYRCGQNILSTRRFTEFTPDHTPLTKFHSTSTNKKKQGGALIVQKMGDFCRFGIQPLALSHEENVRLPSGDDLSMVSFYTLKGGHFDGELLISLQRKSGNTDTEDEDEEEEEEMEEKKEEGTHSDDASDNKDDDKHLVHGEDKSQVIVTVSLIVPKKGRKLSKKRASQLVTALSASIASSVSMETRKTTSRKSQLHSLQQTTHSRAEKRRHQRSENDKKLEEMASDRKRRWRRGSSPDAGRFRPSGDRMRSPNNC